MKTVNQIKQKNMTIKSGYNYLFLMVVLNDLNVKCLLYIDRINLLSANDEECLISKCTAFNW